MIRHWYGESTLHHPTEPTFPVLRHQETIQNFGSFLASSTYPKFWSSRIWFLDMYPHLTPTSESKKWPNILKFFMSVKEKCSTGSSLESKHQARNQLINMWTRSDKNKIKNLTTQLTSMQGLSHRRRLTIPSGRSCNNSRRCQLNYNNINRWKFDYNERETMAVP